MVAGSLNGQLPCSMYSWKINNVVKYSKVCAASSIPQSCYRGLMFKEALAICTTYGARLCTLHELSKNATAGTGCGLDDHMVWSSSSCGLGQYWVHLGAVNARTKGTRSECRHLQQTAAVRCCSSGVGKPIKLHVMAV